MAEILQQLSYSGLKLVGKFQIRMAFSGA